MFDIDRHATTSRIYEPVVKLPGKNVLVIHADHGENEPFPGADVTNREIKKVFGDRLDALVMDSQYNLLRSDLDVVMSQPPSKDDFADWSLRKAKNDQTVLVSADPISYSLSWNIAFKQWIKGTSQLDIDANNQKFLIGASGELDRKQQIAKIEVRKLGIVGLLAVWGITQFLSAKKVIERSETIEDPLMAINTSRRNFILAGLGAVSGGYLYTEGLGSVDSQKATYESETVNSYNTRLWLENLINFPHEMKDTDFNSPYFEHRQRKNELYGESVPLRNAIAAEVIDAVPVSQIQHSPLNDDTVNIATVWGYDHLAVAKKNRISSLLVNPEYRRTVISSGLQSMFDFFRSQAVDPKSIDFLRTSLMDMPKTQRVLADNRIVSARVSVPALVEILSDV